MQPRIIFCAAVSLATPAVILLALLSPLPSNISSPTKDHTRPWLALSLYIQQPQLPSLNLNSNPVPPVGPLDAGRALVFHRKLTEGPENTSQVVGKARGFIVPVEHFAHSAFNLLCLTFHTNEYSGNLSVQAKDIAHSGMRELTVVGGTGSFVFARGLAALVRQGEDATYHVKPQLRFPNRSHMIPG
ncbi:dirigent protein 5 [Malania oleifera]|uniref:dirigent protein 5 n=1 Tax=Malania oleifera TaxID=397392 RepID=UPI0025AE0DCE|nr:dirigent protein 5 [Malania oleifera]